SVATLSNAMDVGNPSNWVRIMDMFGQDTERLKSLVKGYRFTDEQTREAVAEVFEKFDYVVCPHTAVAWLAAGEWRKDNPQDNSAAVFLSTAHPCKFPDIYTEEIASQITIPEQVRALEGKEKQTVVLSADFDAFKKFLLQNE